MDRLYERTSRQCDVVDADAALRSAIAEHAADHQLGDVLADAVSCCETRSVRLYKTSWRSRLKGLADPDTEHRTVALFTHRYLIVAVTGERRGTTVMSARLDGLSLAGSVLESTLSPELLAKASMPRDSGISVTAPWSGAAGAGAEPGAYFIGLGDDADGRAFTERLREAVTAAKSR